MVAVRSRLDAVRDLEDVVRVTWLADVLRAAGLQVIEVDGWRGRGHELTTINGVVEHDTVTGTNWSDESVAHLLRDGRPDLAGPLAQLGLDRHGRYWLIADGKCNHNGYGEWGNQAIGIEAFNDAHEPWPDAQVDAWVRGTAVILKHLGLNEGHALGHKETDPKRKQDPSNFDMDAFRRRVAALLHPTTEAELMRDERIVEIPAPDDTGRQLVNADVDGHGLGLFSKTSSVDVCAAHNGALTAIHVEPFGYLDALCLAVSTLDGKPVDTGRRARIIIEHR